MIEKWLGSGRYFLTLMSGIAFLFCVWKRLLTPGEIATILTMVFTLYFTRSDRPNKEEVK
jgi:hypothetical protein